MEVRYERCCGLDIHKRMVVACLVVPGQGREPQREIRTFGTETRALLEMAEWLALRPWRSKSAIHSASLTSRLRPGTSFRYRPAHFSSIVVAGAAVTDC